MQKKKFKIHPISICVILFFFFFATFLQMTKRFLAYETLEQLNLLRLLREEQSLLEIKKASVQRPSHLQKAAEKLTMKSASLDQFIIMPKSSKSEEE